VLVNLGRAGQGASQMEKLRLYWATEFMTLAYDGAFSLNVSFRKETLELLFRFCRNRSRHVTCFLSD
jgi:hypothetical protein